MGCYRLSLEISLLYITTMTLRCEAEKVDVPPLVTTRWLVPCPEDDLWSLTDTTTDVEKLIKLLVLDSRSPTVSYAASSMFSGIMRTHMSHRRSGLAPKLAYACPGHRWQRPVPGPGS